jgi:hypothetical protein
MSVLRHPGPYGCGLGQDCVHQGGGGGRCEGRPSDRLHNHLATAQCDELACELRIVGGPARLDDDGSGLVRDLADVGGDQGNPTPPESIDSGVKKGRSPGLPRSRSPSASC